MLVRDEVAWPILELAIGHGLAENLMQTEFIQSDVLDLINRLLLADAIDASQAVALIKAVMTDKPQACP